MGLKQAISNYLRKFPPALELYRELEQAGNLYLIGGSLREYLDKGDILKLRDIDIIIDISSPEIWSKIIYNYETERNIFDGYKLNCSGLIVDVWAIEDTWAYKNEIVCCNQSSYVKCITDTVFLNLDAIVYDVKNEIWYDDKYKQAMEDRILDVVLDKNPQILLNLLRAFILKKQYNMVFSKKLNEIVKVQKQEHRDLLDELLQIQQRRYKNEILSKEDIKRELYNVA